MIGTGEVREASTRTGEGREATTRIVAGSEAMTGGGQGTSRNCN